MDIMYGMNVKQDGFLTPHTVAISCRQPVSRLKLSLLLFHYNNIFFLQSYSIPMGKILINNGYKFSYIMGK